MRFSVRLDFRELRLFVAVAESRSITAGAAKLGLALGAASTRIKGVELDLGTRLLVRSRNGVELTEAGEIFLAHARTILELTNALEGDMAPFAKGSRATVHLLSNTAGLAEHLPRPLARFLRSHPGFDVRVEERESAVIGHLISGGNAELGIAVERAVPPSLESFEFCEDRLVIAFPAGHRLSRRKLVSFDEVVGLDFVGLPATSALQNHVLGQARKLGKKIRLRAQVMGLDGVCQMVEAGVGVAIVPESTARRAVTSMKLSRVGLRDAWAHRRLVVCARSFKSLSKPASELVQQLRSIAQARRRH